MIKEIAPLQVWTDNWLASEDRKYFHLKCRSCSQHAEWRIPEDDWWLSSWRGQPKWCCSAMLDEENDKAEKSKKCLKAARTSLIFQRQHPSQANGRLTKRSTVSFGARYLSGEPTVVSFGCLFKRRLSQPLCLLTLKFQKPPKSISDCCLKNIRTYSGGAKPINSATKCIR